MDGEAKYYLLEDCVRNVFGRVMWSHKIQEKQAEIQAHYSLAMTVTNVTLAAATSVGLFSIMFVDRFWLKLASTLASFVSTAIISLSKELDLPDRIKTHRKAAVEYLAVKDQLQNLLMKIHSRTVPLERLEEEFSRLNESVNYINTQAPQTTDRAVRRASRALKVKNDDNITNKEIDNGLPPLLRKGNPDELNGHEKQPQHRQEH
ncbi:SLATT domain-containing protein [Bifidobacterium favimelis]|uniref:SLATT domain-containing protein n=1 Tax=Bifidobacterium favimelis TaxID=3122979 RepID=A0ABU8ZNX9_9BIFI